MLRVNTQAKKERKHRKGRKERGGKVAVRGFSFGGC